MVRARLNIKCSQMLLFRRSTECYPKLHVITPISTLSIQKNHPCRLVGRCPIRCSEPYLHPGVVQHQNKFTVDEHVGSIVLNHQISIWYENDSLAWTPLIHSAERWFQTAPKAQDFWRKNLLGARRPKSTPLAREFWGCLCIRTKHSCYFLLSIVETLWEQSDTVHFCF